MNKYQLGPDIPYDLDYLPGDADWVVYSYENYGYEGDGELVYKHNGRLFTLNLSHCSCYGPLDRLPGTEVFKEDFLGHQVLLGSIGNQAVIDKVTELLQKQELVHPDLQSKV